MLVNVVSSIFFIRSSSCYPRNAKNETRTVPMAKPPLVGDCIYGLSRKGGDCINGLSLKWIVLRAWGPRNGENDTLFRSFLQTLARAGIFSPFVIFLFKVTF